MSAHIYSVLCLLAFEQFLSIFGFLDVQNRPVTNFGLFFSHAVLFPWTKVHLDLKNACRPQNLDALDPDALVSLVPLDGSGFTIDEINMKWWEMSKNRSASFGIQYTRIFKKLIPSFGHFGSSPCWFLGHPWGDLFSLDPGTPGLGSSRPPHAVRGPKRWVLGR